MLKVHCLPPKPTKKKQVTSAKTGKKYTRYVKTENSMSMNTKYFVKFIHQYMVKWCIDAGFKFKNGKFEKGRAPILLMDHERCIRSKKATAELKKLGFEVLKMYPKGSPDLNPIENSWSFLKRKVYNLSVFPDKLCKRKAWIEKIHNAARWMHTAEAGDTLSKIGYQSLKQRCKDVIALGGGKTRW